MNNDNATKMRWAQRLIQAATGEEYGDGLVVTDFGVGIAEPGYGDESTPWALGNWNPKRFRSGDEPPLTNEESLPSRLCDALERIGVEAHWLDEWIQCTECQCIVRNQPDSYGWLPYYLEAVETCDIVCLDCVPDDANEFNDLLTEFDYIDNPTRALMDRITADQLISAGWEKHNGEYANGWHPGQDDDPREINTAIRAENSDVQVLFRVSGKGQFDMHFEAWTRPQPDD